MDDLKGKQSAKNNIVLITPVSKDLLYFKIADSIKNYIKLNHMQPGDKLPSERVLSAQFECGRHSIREAMRILQNESIVKVKIGSGTYISRNSDAGSLFLKLVKVNYLELLSIKTELEKYAVRSVIQNTAVEQLDLLDNILTELELRASQGIFDSDTDKLFHKTLVGLTGNKMLEQIIEKIIEAFDDYAGILLRSSEICMDTIPFHRDLLDAIRAGDPELANQACDRIMEIDSRVLNMIDSQSSGHSL